MPCKLIDEMPCDEGRRHAFARQLRARDAVSPLGGRIPVGPPVDRRDEEGGRPAVLEDPGDLDRIAMRSERGCLEIDERSHDIQPSSVSDHAAMARPRSHPACAIAGGHSSYRATAHYGYSPPAHRHRRKAPGFCRAGHPWPRLLLRWRGRPGRAPRRRCPCPAPIRRPPWSAGRSTDRCHNARGRAD